MCRIVDFRLHFVVSAISEFALPARETARKQAIFVAAEEKKERIAGYSGEYCEAGSLLNKKRTWDVCENPLDCGRFEGEIFEMDRRLLYEGKSKSIYEGDNDSTYVMEFRNSATAGNGAKKAELEGKGELNASISAVIYDYLAKNGIETHLIKMIDATHALVKKTEIVPVEVIIRNTAAGSFSQKYGVSEGTPLKNTVVEFSLKSDELGDPMINGTQITAIGLAGKEEIDEMVRQALTINGLLRALFDRSGIILVDFKLEFGRYEGRIILADEITPDSCRLWDKQTGKKLDKDRFRRDLGDVMGAYTEVFTRLTDEK